MSDFRTDLVKKAFNRIDENDNGVLTESDLKAVYNVSKHPAVKRGEKTEEEIQEIFLRNFKVSKIEGGQVWLIRFI